MFADRSYRQTRAAHLLLSMSTGHYQVSLNRFMKVQSHSFANNKAFSLKKSNKFAFFCSNPCVFQIFVVPLQALLKGKMAEWSIAAVLKTVDPKGFGGSNPSLSAEKDLGLPSKEEPQNFLEKDRAFSTPEREVSAATLCRLLPLAILKSLSAKRTNVSVCKNKKHIG